MAEQEKKLQDYQPPEVDKAQVRAIIAAANPRAGEMRVAMAADAYADYAIAQANIDEYGTVVFHPRTGAPIDNPYLKSRASAAATLIKLAVKMPGLWPAAAAPPDSPPK